MPRIGRHVRVTGRVQGVFFRAWTAEQARELGIAGWVRNCPDGSVEAHLTGDELAVTRMIERLREGPPHAIVERLDVDDVPPEHGERFEIRH
jgi:acylphosphatase